MVCDTVYKTSVGVFRGYVSPIVFILGLFGNIFVIWVFTSKPLRNRFATYSICLASAHIVILITDTLLDDFIGRGLAYAIDGSCTINMIKLDTISNASCKIMQYIPETMYSVSSWIFVVFTIDRALTIYKPLQFYSTFHTKKSIIICFVVILISFLINIPSIISSGLKTSSNTTSTFQKCDILTESEYIASRMELFTKVIVSFVVPTLLVLILNCFIVVKLFHIKKSRKALLATDKTKNGLEMNRVIGHLCLSSFFLLLVFPLVFTMSFRLYWTDNSYTNEKEKVYVEMLSDLSRLFSSLKDVSYAADFYIYFIFLRNFKWYFFDNILNIMFFILPKNETLSEWKTTISCKMSNSYNRYKTKTLPMIQPEKGAENKGFQYEVSTKF